jgi:hypothetical protein
MGTEKLVSAVHNGKFQLWAYKYGDCHADGCGTLVMPTGHYVGLAVARGDSFIIVISSELSVLN